MTAHVLTFRPLFITRIAMGAFVLFAIGYFGVESGPALLAEEPQVLDVVVLASIIGTLLWISWRNWHLGVRLSASEVTVLGFFRDRTVPRSAVQDVSLDALLVWRDRDRDRVRVTPILAFFRVRGGPGAWVVDRNERMLADLRREILGQPEEGEPEEYVPSDDGRSFDAPSYRRPRERSEPPKHVGRYRSLVDALPAVAMLGGSLFFSAFAVWVLAETALWLGGQTPAPGTWRLIISEDPYSRDDALVFLIFHAILAAVALGITGRLLYLVFRPARKSGAPA